MDKVIKIYTDGGSRNHGNVKGGHVKSTDSAAWAYLIEYPNSVTINRSGFSKGKTNNQMELRAVIEALSTLTNQGHVKLSSPRLEIITDSKYIYDAFTKGWIQKWRKKRFNKVKNADYWVTLLYMISHVAEVRFKWTKGHADNKGNNLVDKLLNAKMDQAEKLIKKKKVGK